MAAKRVRKGSRTSDPAQVSAVLLSVKEFEIGTRRVCRFTSFKNLNRLSQKELRDVLYSLRTSRASLDSALARVDKMLDTRNDMARAAMMQRE